MAIMDPRVGRLVGHLSIACMCGYRVSWPVKLAVKRLGAHTRPADVHLRCTACGATTSQGKVRVSGDMR